MPSRRLATVADVTHAVFFLLDGEGINGRDLAVDDGVRFALAARTMSPCDAVDGSSTGT